MSDSDESGVTHTKISSPFEDLSDIGSPGVVGLKHEGLPGCLRPSPPPPDFVLEPVYPEYMPLEDEVFPDEEQPLLVAASPIAQSPDYVLESDPEVDPEEDNDEDPEEDLVDYPVDEGDDALPICGCWLYKLLIRPIWERTELFETDEVCGHHHYHTLISWSPGISIPDPVLQPVWSECRREDRPEVTLPPRKRLGIALGLAYEVGESSSAAAARPTRGLRADYGFVATIDREIRRDLERDRMTLFETRVRRDTYEVYTRLDNEQNGQQYWLAASHGRSMDVGDLAHAEVMSLRTIMLAQQSQIRELQSADRRRQMVITEMLAADHMRQKQLTEALKLIKRLQTQMTEFERTAGHAKGPVQPELPEEAEIAPKKRTTRLNPETKTITPATTSVTNSQLKVIIDQGVTAALATCDANTNDVDSHTSGTGVRGNERATRETAGNDIAYAMTWTKLKKKMTDKCCLRTEIKKLEVKLWDLNVKESDKIERYVSGLPDMIHGSVVASKLKTMQEVTEIATELIDKRIHTFAERQIENKRKQDNNQQEQPQNKRQNTGRAYAAGTGKKKLYGRSKPLCPKCNYHHDGPCIDLAIWPMIAGVLLMPTLLITKGELG
ncbi:hypothetical protein Tco_0807729 [Tanacetum coccineum]